MAAILLVVAFVSYAVALTAATGVVSLRHADVMDVLNFRIDRSQRCYSFSCFFGTVTQINWSNLPALASVTFYQGRQCRGEYVTVPTTESLIPAGDDRLYNAISSVMVWQSGMYATGGIVDVCFKERALTVNGSSSPTARAYQPTLGNSSSGGSTGCGNAAFVGDSGEGAEKELE